MLVLTGNVGKSVVLRSLIETHKDIYAIIYDKHALNTLETLFVSSDNFSVEELCEGIKRDINSECRCRELVVIYTNLCEADAFVIKNLIKELESDKVCRNGIIMCKEDWSKKYF